MPKQLCVELLELGEQLLVQGQLIGADRAPVLRIEHEDHRLTPKLGERHGLIGCRSSPKSGASVPGGSGVARWSSVMSLVEEAVTRVYFRVVATPS